MAGSTLLAGGVQIAAGSNYPVRFEILSHFRKQTLEPWSPLYNDRRDRRIWLSFGVVETAVLASSEG